MARDTELADEQNHEAEAADKPQSVRESIISARDEVAEKSDDGKTVESSERVEKPKRRENKKSNDESLETDTEDKKPTRSDGASSEDDTEASEDASDKTEVAKPKGKAPVGWTKEAKAKWDTLPPEIQDSVLKREKEVSDGFAGTKQAQERLSRYDAVVNPRLQAIQEFGVTPEQTIDRLFQWMEALSHQNEGMRYQSFKTLADNFKIDLTKFAPQTQADGQTTTQQPQQSADNYPPEWAQSLIERQRAIDQQFVTQRQETAKSYVESWAKDKPHFEKVRTAMHGLITSGAVPLKANGELDLDTAYSKAIRMDDELWETVQQEKSEAAAAERAKADAKKRAAAEQARRAGSSIRPSAPAPTNGLNGSRSSTAKRNNVSAAQSIRDAIKEVSER